MTLEDLHWEQITYPRFGDKVASEIPEWARDPEWPIRYTHYADALLLAAEARQSINTDGPDSREARDLLERLGDPSRGVWRGLDTSSRELWQQGEFLLFEVFDSVLERLVNECAGPWVAADFPILAWYLLFQARSRQARQRVYEEQMGAACTEDINTWIRATAWPDGLRELERSLWTDTATLPSLSPDSVPALRRLTEYIDQRLADEVPTEPPFDFAAPFAGLLPPDLAQVLHARTENLRRSAQSLRDRGEHLRGIDADGFTELWRQGLPVLQRRLRFRESMLLIGPTTTGKTDFSRIAAAHVIWNRRKVIVLLPTKALVSQAAEEWTAFFSAAESSKDWKILEASRDHPYNDEDIIRGDYDIVLAIPEKLAAYLAGGLRVLDQCGLLVVDELQTLSQPQRGANIESLITIVKAQHPEVPIIGLSATLTDDSSRTIRAWLGVGDSPEEGFVATRERPVVLDRLASEPSAWMQRSPDNEVTEGAWESPLSSAEIKELLKSSGVTKAAHRDAVALATALLQRQDSIDEAKSVIVFVGSRRAAELLTEGLQALLDNIGLGETASWRSPHYGRFGRSVMSEEEARVRDAEFLALPNLPATEDVREGLSTGVMYHNARLDPAHRRIIEHAFQDKIIRVLVATATLAVGVNLPADFVIVADVTEGTSEFEGNAAVERLLDPHDIAQRFGRCGRLGMSTHGEAFVLVQRGGNNERPLRLTREQRDFFVARKTSHDALPEVDLQRLIRQELSSLETVFAYFVMSEDSGEPVTSNLNDKSFARLLLQDMSRGAPALSREEIESRLLRTYEVSLLREQGNPCPNAFDLIDILDTNQLIGPAPEDHTRFKVTGLGRTVALSNVPVTNARGIREVAEAALLGAGPLTVLTIAAQAEYVRELTWLGLPHEQNPDLLARIRYNVWRLVRAFGSAERIERDAFKAPEFLDAVPELNGSLIGSGQAAQAVAGRLDLGVERLSDTYVVAHLRACIAWLWQRGLPMIQIISVVEDNTEATLKGRSRRIDAYPADVRDLGERVSYVLNAAAEVLRVSPGNNRQYVMLKNLAESLQSGVPYQLAPMLRLKRPRIHRERLVQLLDMRDEELDYDDLASVLATLSTPRADRSAQQKRAHANIGFTQEETREILAGLSRSPLRVGGRALPPGIRDERTPSRHEVGGGVTYARVADDMARNRSLKDKVERLAYLLEDFGLVVRHSGQAVNGAMEVTLGHGEDEHAVTLVVLEKELDGEVLSPYRDRDCCLVLLNGLTRGAEVALRAPHLALLSAMTISVFIAGLAKIDAGWRKNYFGEDPDAELGRRVLLFLRAVSGYVNASDISLAEVAAGLPAPPPLFAS